MCVWKNKPNKTPPNGQVSCHILTPITSFMAHIKRLWCFKWTPKGQERYCHSGQSVTFCPEGTPSACQWVLHLHSLLEGGKYQKPENCCSEEMSAVSIRKLQSRNKISTDKLFCQLQCFTDIINISETICKPKTNKWSDFYQNGCICCSEPTVLQKLRCFKLNATSYHPILWVPW